MTMELARYEADSGKEIVITDDDIKYAIAGNQNVTNVEMRLFVELCMAHHFDPFIKEVHLIKFKDKPATIVIKPACFCSALLSLIASPNMMPPMSATAAPIRRSQVMKNVSTVV